jgi:hypothetical protein
MLVTIAVTSTMLAIVAAWLPWQFARRRPTRPERGPERAAADGTTARSRTAAAIALAVFVFGAGAAVTVVLTGTTAPPASASAGATRSPAPLELVELGQARHGDTLAVHGVVRNPARGAQMNGVSAVVVLLDRAGAPVTSGVALVENGDLAPGSESRFRVVVAGARNVARYRVSFRTDRGIAAHVDRRTMAAKGHGR